MEKVRVAIKSLPFAGRFGGYRPHSVVEIDLDEARELVASGHASYVGEEPVVSIMTADAQPQQNAMRAPIKPLAAAERKTEVVRKIKKKSDE